MLGIYPNTKHSF